MQNSHPYETDIPLCIGPSDLSSVRGLYVGARGIHWTRAARGASQRVRVAMADPLRVGPRWGSVIRSISKKCQYRDAVGRTCRVLRCWCCCRCCGALGYKGWTSRRLFFPSSLRSRYSQATFQLCHTLRPSLADISVALTPRISLALYLSLPI